MDKNNEGFVRCFWEKWTKSPLSLTNLSNKMFESSLLWSMSDCSMVFVSSFRGITPGLTVDIGAYGKRNRLEMRYTIDMNTFRIKGIPIGGQRRSFIGVNYAFGIASD